MSPDLASLSANRTEPTLTWLGHATFLLQLGGVNILTDPHLSDRPWPFRGLGPKRVLPPPLQVSELPHIHAVVLSHNHHEHVDRTTLAALARQRISAPRFFAPLGLRSWVRSRSYTKCEELAWWQWSQFKGITLHFVPSQHWSGRTPWDQNESLWGGWIIDHPSFRFYFAGDSGYSPDFELIGKRFAPIDLAALPISGGGPKRLTRHYQLTPEEALKAHRDVGARHSVGMSWGTFLLAREAADEPVRRLAQARQDMGIAQSEFFVMQPGETLSLKLLKHNAMVHDLTPAPKATSARRADNAKPVQVLKVFESGRNL